MMLKHTHETPFSSKYSNLDCKMALSSSDKYLSSDGSFLHNDNHMAAQITQAIAKKFRSSVDLWIICGSWIQHFIAVTSASKNFLIWIYLMFH